MSETQLEHRSFIKFLITKKDNEQKIIRQRMTAVFGIEAPSLLQSKILI